MEEGCHVKTFQRVQPRLVVAALQGNKKSLISAIETTKNNKRTNADAGRGAASGPASARDTNTMRLFYAFPQRRRKKKKEEGNKNVFLSSSFLFFRPTAIAVIAFHPSQLAKPGPGRDGSFPPKTAAVCMISGVKDSAGGPSRKLTPSSRGASSSCEDRSKRGNAG